MGVGDLLRSSAAWRALKNRWPLAKLHLLFLSKHEGYPTEGLIAEHHLLSSAHFVTIQRGHPGLPKAQRPKVGLWELVRQVRHIARECRADWVIDFEPSGARTSVLTWFAAQAVGAHTLGVNQVFPRALFYEQSSPSVGEFARQRGLALPLEYTYRDFVVLAAWGIEREGLAIELRVSEEGARVAKVLENQLARLEAAEIEGAHNNPNSSYAQYLKHLGVHASPSSPIRAGLNIGCGTADAMYKRPDLERLVQCVQRVSERYPVTWVLSGAPNEREINEAFIQLYRSRTQFAPLMLDFAGQCSLSGLTGLINACDVFVSTDSGPYHMAVALKVPTLVWFTYAEHCSFHEHAWVRRLIDPSVLEFEEGFEALLTNKC
jgi:ADP-heptose:LPS heptosyltransferase